MSDIAKPQRAWFAERFIVGRPATVVQQVSTDGTRKWLLKTDDGHDFEMVFIPDADRGTLCVSAQVGCTLNCRFCHTGTMRLVRNLTAGEIVGQVMLARDALGEWPSQPEGRLLSNIVMMGMGEPLYNFDNVAMRCASSWTATARAVQASHHAVDLRGRADDGAGRGRRSGSTSPSRCTRSPRRCATRSCPSNRKYGIEELLEPAPLIRRQQCTAHHLRICDAEGQE
jgi:23S rRNA (adenine2503-C2)-methyltransferase